MKLLPTAPAPGTPVSASLIRELIDAIRERTILRGRGYRTRETPSGTYLEIDVNTPSKPKKQTPGCFDIRYPNSAGPSDPGGFDNPYYMVGSRIYDAPDLMTCSSVATPESRALKIFVLVVDLSGSEPTAGIMTFYSMADVQRLADDNSISIFPLYEFDKYGNVKCDFRTVPNLVGKEWPQ